MNVTNITLVIPTPDELNQTANTKAEELLKLLEEDGLYDVASENIIGVIKSAYIQGYKQATIDISKASQGYNHG